MRILSGILLGIWLLFQGEMLVHSWDHCCGHDEHSAHHSGSQGQHQSEDCEFCQLFHSPFTGSETIGFGIHSDGTILVENSFLQHFHTAGYQGEVAVRGPPVI